MYLCLKSNASDLEQMKGMRRCITNTKTKLRWRNPKMNTWIYKINITLPTQKQNCDGQTLK
jgi:hypothetical protein